MLVRIYILSMFVFLKIVFVPLGPEALGADNIFRIEIGESKRKTNMDELQDRIYHLERAVRQLQNRVFELEDSARTTSKNPPKTYTCVLQTDFNGTFSSTKPSLSEARADVLKQCSAKGRSNFWCKADQLECGE